jgi:hypothetical protein
MFNFGRKTELTEISNALKIAEKFFKLEVPCRSSFKCSHSTDLFWSIGKKDFYYKNALMRVNQEGYIIDYHLERHDNGPLYWITLCLGPPAGLGVVKGLAKLFLLIYDLYSKYVIYLESIDFQGLLHCFSGIITVP